MGILSIRLFVRAGLITAGALIGSVLSLSMATAATYNVATTGSDSNSCSTATNISTPKRNIMGASGGLACLKAGDTLYIRSGTYTESINSNKQTIPAGTSWTNAVTIAAYNGETVTLQPGNGDFGIALGTVGIRYLIISGLIVNCINQNSSGTDACVSLWGGANLDYIRIQNTEVKNAWMHGLVAGGAALEFINLTVHDNGRCAPSTGVCNGVPVHGMYFLAHDSVLEKSTFFNNPVNGVQVYSSGCSTCTNNDIVRYNTFHDNGLANNNTYYSAGLVISSGSNVQVYGNVAYNNFMGIHAYRNCTNALVYNNIVYNNRHFGITVGDGVAGVQVYNNTTYNNKDFGFNIGQSGSTNTIVKNNIAFGNGNPQIYVDSAAVGTVLSNNVTTDPKFVNVATNDFHLQLGSSAIDSGVTLATVPVDFAGIARPQGSAYDIGAYEYSTTSALPTAPANLQVTAQ